MSWLSFDFFFRENILQKRRMLIIKIWVSNVNEILHSLDVKYAFESRLNIHVFWCKDIKYVWL